LVRNVIGGVTAAMLAMLSGCGPSYSPNTYAGAAVQQANPAQRGLVVGIRKVAVSADATLGTITGAAAGGIAGAQVDGGGPVTALSALGGSVLGGVVGSGVEHATGDTTAFEYIVQETKGDLVSVTQRDTVPLAIGEKVLVITGKQARVVPDYTVALPEPPPATSKQAEKDKPAAPSSPVSVPPAAAPVTATPLPQTSAAATPGSASPPIGGAATSGSASPPTGGTATPAATSVAAPVAATVAGSSPAPATSPPGAPTTPAGSSRPGSSPAAAQPGAPVSLALPATPASPTPTTPAPSGDPAPTSSEPR
jgi:outer membrane lipoprotein SlyB